MYPRRSLKDLLRALALVIGLGAFALLSGCASEAHVNAVPKPAVVQHPGAAAGGAIAVYSGSVHARYESVLGFRVAGKVKARPVDVGARVKQGQVLAELDPDDAKLALSSAQAQASWAKADLALAKAEYERHQSMLDKHLISQSLFDAKRNAYEAAAAKEKQASAQLSVTQNQSNYTSLRADADGVITQVSAEPGQVVAAGQPVVALARDGAREVLINVPEGRIGEFKAGTPVSAELWASEGKKYSGTVREVAPEADAMTRTYNVRVSLAEPDAAIKLGMTARVYLVSGGDLSIAVPLAALAAKNGKPAVWLVDPRTGLVKLVPVEVGAYGESTVTVQGGITRYDWIVVAGVHKLSEGQVVRPVDAQLKPIEIATH
jgi:multidrug efflux system membrane fusion protein